jgi:hypothetical protein
MAKKSVKKETIESLEKKFVEETSRSPIHPYMRPTFDISTGMQIPDPFEEKKPEPEPEKSIEEKVEDEILATYGDIPRGATELYLRAILRELVRARIK